MTLLRYNREPVLLNPENIQDIYAKNGLLYVDTKDGQTHVGYFIKN